MKPHIFAQMVNEVRDLALNFGASQQFRDRASDLMSKYIPIESSPESGLSIAVLADVALDVHAMQYKIEQKDEEIERLRKKIAELEARAVVVPELLAVEKFADNGSHSHWIIIRRDTGGAVWEEPDPDEDSRTEIPLLLQSIPADRVLGERQVAVDREKLDQLWWIEDPREWHESLEKLGAKNGFDALRTQAGKDGAA